ncbi:MAG: hypothetical protein M1143_01055 [Candidatus Thermoplasmatota archaeon]|nr:hypothetical protein [Candidatus Thermoplasmatota archaeon]
MSPGVPPPPAPTGGDRGTPVLLDANVLIMTVKERFPLDQEVHRLIEDGFLAVPSSVRRELERLSRRGLFAARGALALAEKYRQWETDLEGDAALETLGREVGAWIVTMDRELRDRLETARVGVLYPCGRQRLCSSRSFMPRRPDAVP